jgi:cation transport protein ChaC
LIWNPGFDHVEARRGIVHGWRRSLCIHITNWRGTPETPGLMLGLAPGGACSGVAYLMPEDDPEGRMLRLLRREHLS